jgi:hypothetical protein
MLRLRCYSDLAFEANGVGTGRYLVCDKNLICLRVHTLDSTDMVVIVTHLAEGVTRASEGRGTSCTRVF